MKPQNLQRLIKSQSEVLSRLYAEYSDLKENRKRLNEMADSFTALEDEPYSTAFSLLAERETKPINKLKKRIAGLEECQKELKSLLRHAQVVALLDAEDDAFWLAQESAVQEEGDADPKGVVNIWSDDASGAWQV